MSAPAVIAQLAPGFSAQRISSGAPGTENTFSGFIAFRSHMTIVFPKFFIAAAVLDELRQIHHVVGPAGEARCEHAVLAGIDGDVVAIAVAAVVERHRRGRDEIAGVVVGDQPGDAAVVLLVRQRLHQHAAGQRIESVRPDDSRVLSARLSIVLTSFGVDGSEPTSKMKILLSSRRPAQRYLRSSVKPM